MSGPRESKCAIFLRSGMCIWNNMALSIRCDAAWGHLPCGETLYCLAYGQDDRNAVMGADTSGRLRGGDVRVAFPVPVGALVLSPPNGARGRQVEQASGASDRAVQAGAALRHDPATDL